MESYFISCDWGTSNLRLYLVDVVSFKVINEISNNHGIKDFYKLWEKSGKSREAFFQEYLNRQVTILQEKTNINLSEVKVFASGMITSSLGMQELPYAEIPNKLIPDQLITETTNRFTLISGLKSDKDVLRGEETLIMGILSDQPDFQGTIILPGTHSKHATINNGILVDFHTYLSGEIFHLLVNESSLSHTLDKCKIIGDESLENSFLKGIHDSNKNNLLNKVFHARANSLLKGTSKRENYALLSGIIIGTELQNIVQTQQEIILCGDATLCELYSLALRYKQIKNVKHYSDKIAMIKGHFAFMK